MLKFTFSCPEVPFFILLTWSFKSAADPPATVRFTTLSTVSVISAAVPFAALICKSKSTNSVPAGRLGSVVLTLMTVLSADTTVPTIGSEMLSFTAAMRAVMLTVCSARREPSAGAVPIDPVNWMAETVTPRNMASVSRLLLIILKFALILILSIKPALL